MGEEERGERGRGKRNPGGVRDDDTNSNNSTTGSMTDYAQQDNVTAWVVV